MRKYILGFLMAVMLASCGSATDVNVTFNWLAVHNGEDSTCATYDMRYVPSDSTGLLGGWASAIHISGEPIPSAPGVQESMTKTLSLSVGETYYFALKVFDQQGAESMSNIVSYLVPNQPPQNVTLELIIQ